MEILYAWDYEKDEIVNVSQSYPLGYSLDSISAIDPEDFHQQQAMIHTLLNAPNLIQKTHELPIPRGFIIKGDGIKSLPLLNHEFNQQLPRNITVFDPLPFKEEEVELIEQHPIAFPITKDGAKILWVGRIRSVA